MHPARADIPDGQDSASSEISLHIEIPLLLVRRLSCIEWHSVTQAGAPDAVVGEIIRRARGGHVLRWQHWRRIQESVRKGHRSWGKLVIVKRWVKVVGRGIGARGNGIMEDPVAGADRGPLVPEWRPSQTNAWIDVLLVRAA